MRQFLYLSIFAISFLAIGCSSNYTVVEDSYGEPFDIKDVSWTQDLSEHGKTLRWSVDFKNETGYGFSGPRGVGIHFLGMTEGVTAEITSVAFIDTVTSFGRHTISGEIITDQIPDHARIRFVE